MLGHGKGAVQHMSTNSKGNSAGVGEPTSAPDRGPARSSGVLAEERRAPAGSYEEAVARLQEENDGVAALHALEQRMLQQQTLVRILHLHPGPNFQSFSAKESSTLNNNLMTVNANNGMVADTLYPTLGPQDQDSEWVNSEIILLDRPRK